MPEHVSKSYTIPGIQDTALLPRRTLTAGEIEQGIVFLQGVRTHPVMYIGSIDVELTKSWIYGFHCAIGIFFIEELGIYRDQILRKRGWENTPRHHSHQMVTKGMSAREIVNELFAIEIQIWQCAAQQIKKAEASK